MLKLPLKLPKYEETRGLIQLERKNSRTARGAGVESSPKIQPAGRDKRDVQEHTGQVGTGVPSGIKSQAEKITDRPGKDKTNVARYSKPTEVSVPSSQLPV